MAEKSKFIEELNSRYQPKGEYIVLGKGMLDGVSNYGSRCYSSSEKRSIDMV